MAIDIVRAANDSNTAIHVVDPRGLQVNSPLFGGPLEIIASGTGGDFLRTNDIPGAFARMIKQVSALYLLGYTREMPLDGLFHRIKVRVKRGGVEVRAREAIGRPVRKTSKPRGLGPPPPCWSRRWPLRSRRSWRRTHRG